MITNNRDICVRFSRNDIIPYLLIISNGGHLLAKGPNLLKIALIGLLKDYEMGIGRGEKEPRGCK